MRGFSLTTDMDFRVIPSAIPLQSPSPDRRSINVITPTISPNAIQIKKGTTPIKNFRYQKENNKSGYEQETQIKYHSQHVGGDISSALKQKDDIIRNLRNVIDMITQNNRYKKSNQSQESDLKNQVKILTIQNQKLVNIIDKMSKSKPLDEGTTKINQQYEQKIDQLMKTLKQNETFHQQQTKQLKRFNKSLNAHCKSLQNQKKQLQLQNKKLLAILKQRNDGQKKQKLKLSDASENSNEEKSSHQSQTKNNQRLTLMKIRQQHSQNLKALKQGLIKQIEQTFDTMKIALDGINIKMTALSKRLESIEKMTWARVRKTHVQTQSITISIRQGVQHEDPVNTDRSYKPQRKHNSEIYIEQGPSSSHQKASRDQFSRLEEVSSTSQKNLVNPLQEQLNAVKAELHQLRFKYDKLCMDTSQLGFSQRIKPQQFSGISDRYKQTMLQIGNKDKEINILYDQIRKIEQQNIAQHKKKDQCIRQKQIEVEKIKQIHQQQLQQIKNQTELKVKLLAQNYQKQIQLLHRQLMIKNANLNEASESIFIEKSEYNRKIQGQTKRASQLQIQNKDLKQKLRAIENTLILEKENSEKLYKNLEQQLKLAQQTNDNNRKKSEQFQQQTLLKISESSQQKMQIQTLRAQLQAKTQQSQQAKRSKQEAQQNLQKQLQNNIKLRKLLMQKQNMIVKLRQAIAQWNNSSILEQINEIKQLLEKQKQQQQSFIEKHVKLGQQKQRYQKLLTQLNNLRQQNEHLRNQLISKDQLTTQLQAKVMELQNLYEMVKAKLHEQQQLHIQLMDKVSEYEKQISHIKIEKEQFIARYQSRVGFKSEAIMGKVEEIRNLQIQRNQYIHRLFEQAKSHPQNQ